MNIIADYDKVEYKRGSSKTFMKYSLRIFDFILVSLFAVAAIFCFTRFFSSVNKKNKILIVKTPHEKYAYSLNKNVEFTTEGSIGKTKIKIENGKAFVTESCCDNKNCINMGKLSRVNDYAACLPNGIILYIEGEDEKEKIDAIVN